MRIFTLIDHKRAGQLHSKPISIKNRWVRMPGIVDMPMYTKCVKIHPVVQGL